MCGDRPSLSGQQRQVKRGCCSACELRREPRKPEEGGAGRAQHCGREGVVGGDQAEGSRQSGGPSAEEARRDGAPGADGGSVSLRGQTRGAGSQAGPGWRQCLSRRTTGLEWASPHPCRGEQGQGGCRGTRMAFGGSSRQPRGGSSSAGLGGGIIGTGAGGWSVRSLVPAAAGVGARLAGGEVFGSHAGGVLEERGKEGQQGAGQGQAGQWPPQGGPWWVSQSQPSAGKVDSSGYSWKSPIGRGWGRGSGPDPGPREDGVRLRETVIPREQKLALTL